jgi:hypothetical protein
MTVVAAIFDRPATNTLTVAVICAALGWALHWWAEYSTRPRRAEPGDDHRPEPADGQTLEPPAVVGLLTNEFNAPRTAVTATAIDLAARGWVRLSSTDGELMVVTRGNPTAGDSLKPFEQQVLNHLASRAFNDVSSASTLASSHHRLDRRWWLRFERAVADESAARGLSTRRYSAVELAPPAAVALIALAAWWFAGRGGDEIAITDSWKPRTIWVLTLVAIAGLVWATVVRAMGGAQRPTELGRDRMNAWMGFRARLRDRIPDHAGVLAPPAQQQALAQACVMGVATHVLDEFPAAPEHPRIAWSEAGGIPHLVRIRYPFRPGYGQHPVKVAAVGLIVLVLVRWLQSYLEKIGDGEALTSLLEKVPGQVELIKDIADILALICWLPLLWAAWALAAGATDSIATRVRIGSVVRARRPADVLPPLLVNVVKPFAERDRFSTYLAVDDGNRRTVWAWLANERSAAPQGAQARVRATPMLGYVRSSEPVGTGTRPMTAPSTD